MTAKTAVYSGAGVDQDLADRAVEALVGALRPGGREGKSREVLASGHFANVIRVTESLGIALSTDGVGTKLLIAERLGRFDTIGIDCIAMNVNDLICVGAEPLAMLDYLAVETANPEREAEIGTGLRRGSELAGIEIPGGELAQLGSIIHGFDIAGACFGRVALDRVVTGRAIAPGDAIVGLPSSGLHANGYSLARKAIEDLSLEDDPDGQLGESLGDALIEPTEIYVAAVMELLRSDVDVRGLAHITSKGFGNLLRLENANVGYEIDDPLPVLPIFRFIQDRMSVSNEEMQDVFNLGCGFCCVVPADMEDRATAVLRGHCEGARRIGRVTDEAGQVRCPPGWPATA